MHRPGSQQVSPPRAEPLQMLTCIQTMVLTKLHCMMACPTCWGRAGAEGGSEVPSIFRAGCRSELASISRRRCARHPALHGAGSRRWCSGLQVKGDNVYSKLKFESGVHRVQRVPATESSGRVHTSTATVAIMPEVGAGQVAPRVVARSGVVASCLHHSVRLLQSPNLL